MSKKRILLVDDDIASSRLLRMGLERTGLYDVAVANLGSQALDVALKFKPDMAVLDVCMPDMDGGDVANVLQGHPDLSNVPVVFLTSIVSKDEEGKHTFGSGGFHFIAKPVSLEKLVRFIEATLTVKNEKPESAPTSPAAFIVR